MFKAVDIANKFQSEFFKNGRFQDSGEFVPIRKADNSFCLTEVAFKKLQREFVKLPKASALDLVNPVGPSTVECITFKRSGNYFNNGGINYMNYKGEIVNSISHSVTLIGGYIIDFNTGINGMTIPKYLRKLYELNNKVPLRIAMTMSKFTFSKDDALIAEMCNLLSTRDGLEYDKFIELLEQDKQHRLQEQALLNDANTYYIDNLPEFHSHFSESSDGVDAVKELRNILNITLQTVEVRGKFRTLTKEGELILRTNFTVSVTDDLLVLDPVNGWEPMPLDLWISLLAPFNSDMKFRYEVTLSSKVLSDKLELRTYGDMEAMRRDGSNTILSITVRNTKNMLKLMSIVRDFENKEEVDMSSIVAPILFNPSLTLRKQLEIMLAKEDKNES